MKSSEIIKWQERIQVAEAWRAPYEKVWRRTIGYLRGIYYGGDDLPSASTSGDNIAVNLVYPHVRTIIPAIYSRNPEVLIRASRMELDDAARALAAYIKYALRELDVKSEMKLCVLDAILTGIGWVKTGYQTDFILDEKPSSVVKEFIARLGSKLGIKQEEETEASTYAIQANERVVSESSWVLRTSPFNMAVGYCERLEEAPFIAEKRFVPTTDVKKNPNFKNNKDIKGTISLRDVLRKKQQTLTGGDKVDTDDDFEYSILHEVYDLREGTVFTIAEGHEKELEEPRPNEYGKFLDSRHPYLQLVFNPVSDQFYPQNDVEAWEAQNHELNRLRSQFSLHTKRYNRKYAASSTLSDKSMNDLMSGEDGIVIKSEQMDENLDNLVKPISDAALPPEVYAHEQRIKEDQREISGISAYQKGGSTGAKSATEAAIVDSGARIRVDERLDIVGAFAGRICRNLAMIAQKYTSAEQISEMIGVGLGQHWLKIEENETIKREFFFEIVFGSSAPVDVAADRQQFIGFAEGYKNDPYMNRIKIREELVRKLGYRDPETWLDPMVAQMMEQRMQEMAATPGILGPDGLPARGATAGRAGSEPGAVPSTGSLDSGMKRLGQRHGSPGGRILVDK